MKRCPSGIETAATNAESRHADMIIYSRTGIVALCSILLSAFTTVQKDAFSVACAGSIVTKSIDGPRLPHGMVDNRHAICGCILNGLKASRDINAKSQKLIVELFQRIAANLPSTPRHRGAEWRLTQKTLMKVMERCGGKHAKPAAFSASSRAAFSATCRFRILDAKAQRQSVPQHVIVKRVEICGCIADKLGADKYLGSAEKREAIRIFDLFAAGDRDNRRTLRRRLQQKWGKFTFRRVRRMAVACFNTFRQRP